jgi:hypothetical protein
MCATAGGGPHTWGNTYADYQRFYYYLSVCKVIFYVAVGMIKLSITLFVRRLTNSTSRTWQMLADGFLVTVVCSKVTALVWNLCLCSRSRATWDEWYAGTLINEPRCNNINLNSRVLGIIHSTQGMALLLAPVVILWRVQISLAKKVRLFIFWATSALSVLFGLLQLILTSDSTGHFLDF